MHTHTHTHTHTHVISFCIWSTYCCITLCAAGKTACWSQVSNMYFPSGIQEYGNGKRNAVSQKTNQCKKKSIMRSGQRGIQKQNMWWKRQRKSVPKWHSILSSGNRLSGIVILCYVIL